MSKTATVTLTRGQVLEIADALNTTARAFQAQAERDTRAPEQTKDIWLSTAADRFGLTKELIAALDEDRVVAPLNGMTVGEQPETQRRAG